MAEREGAALRAFFRSDLVGTLFCAKSANPDAVVRKSGGMLFPEAEHGGELVPTLCVGMPSRALCVVRSRQRAAERPRGIPTQSVGTSDPISLLQCRIPGVFSDRERLDRSQRRFDRTRPARTDAMDWVHCVMMRQQIAWCATL